MAGRPTNKIIELSKDTTKYVPPKKKTVGRPKKKQKSLNRGGVEISDALFEEICAYGLGEYLERQELTPLQIKYLMRLIDYPLQPTKARRISGISKGGLESAMKHNYIFFGMIEDIKNGCLEEIQAVLHDKAKNDRDFKSIEFLLKSQAKHMGYGQQEVVREVETIGIDFIDANEDGNELDDSSLLEHFDSMEEQENEE